MKVVPIVFVIVVFLSVNIAQTAFGSANGNWPHIKGKVVAVDVEDSMVTIRNAKNQQMTFQVVPTSEIKIKDHGFLKWDRDASLKDVNIGQWISVTYYGSRETKIVRDIDIFLDTTSQNVPPLIWLVMARARVASHRQ